MTRTAIVAALHDELSSVLELMPDEHKQVIGGRECWVGHLHGQDVVAVLSGIGKVAAATTGTLLAERFQVSGIVFTGVAGGLGDGVRVGDVVVARQFLQHDLDASPLFPRHEIPGYGRSTFEADAGLTERGFAAVALSGEHSQNERNNALQALRMRITRREGYEELYAALAETLQAAVPPAVLACLYTTASTPPSSRSARLTPSDGSTANTLGEAPSSATETKSLTGSYGTFA